MAANTSITVLVHRYASGDKAALNRLLPLVYTELRRIARRNLRDERPGHTLQPTALVHEMYARLGKLSLEEARDACMEKPAIMVRIDDALYQLARHDARKSQLIEMRFFGGLTAEESAIVLDLPVELVRRELRVGQAWLQRELDQGSGGTSASAEAQG